MEIGRFYMKDNDGVYQVCVFHDGYVSVAKTTVWHYFRNFFTFLKLVAFPDKIESKEHGMNVYENTVAMMLETIDKTHFKDQHAEFLEKYGESKDHKPANYIG